MEICTAGSVVSLSEKHGLFACPDVRSPSLSSASQGRLATHLHSSVGRGDGLLRQNSGISHDAHYLRGPYLITTSFSITSTIISWGSATSGISLSVLAITL